MKDRKRRPWDFREPLWALLYRKPSDGEYERFCMLVSASKSHSRMSKSDKATLNYDLVPIDLTSTKESLPHQTVMKTFCISIIAHGLPFCRRRVSIWLLFWKLSNREYVSISDSEENVLLFLRYHFLNTDPAVFISILCSLSVIVKDVL